MHELSVAMRIVETLAEELGGARVAAVTVRVGAMSGVVPEALAFAWSPATRGTAFAGSRLDIEPVDAAAWCGRCRAERIVPAINRLRCPVCQSPLPELLRGRELEVLTVEVVDEDPPGASADADPQAERRAGAGPA
jgi:hydrogenase nickel incorporation protein HypA/HybF